MEQETKTESGISLSLWVAVWTAIAIGICMLLYAGIQYALLSERSLKDLLIHHLWHVLVLGAVIHMMLGQLFKQHLIKPINKMYWHLYQIGKGNMDKLSVDSNIRELNTIAEGINMMTWRMSKWINVSVFENARKEIEELKVLTTSLKMAKDDIAEAMEERILSLEATINQIEEIHQHESEETVEVKP